VCTRKREEREESMLELEYKLGYIKEYIKGIYYSILNKRITRVEQEVVQIPFTIKQVEHIDKLFPVVNYTLNKTTIQDVAFTAGQRTVVEYIRRWSKQGSTIGGVYGMERKECI